MSGRKPKTESRAAEFRQRLVIWQQTPEATRPSLRSLAKELRTSHALLQYYLEGLEEWQADVYWRRSKEIRAAANAEGRLMTPWEEQQQYALDRRAMCLFIEATFEDHAKKLEREIEQTIKDGKAPATQAAKMLRMIASAKGASAAAHRGSQRARALLQKYFSPEGQKAIQARLRAMPRPPKPVRRKVPEAQYRQIRLQKLYERFEEIGGALLLDEGQVRCFVPEESPVSRVLLAELAKYHEELKRILELNPGKVDFSKVKARICQRSPSVQLTPLESHLGKRKTTGNSAGTRGEETGAHAFNTSTLVS